MLMEKRSGLYRSSRDNMIGGVAGGVGESTNLDPTLIRILFILMVLVGGGGVLLYVILWIVLPLDTQLDNNIKSETMEEQKTNENGQSGVPQNDPKFKKKDDGSLIAGLILITLGVIFLVIRYVPRIDFGDLWPVILIVIGIVLLRNAYVGKNKQ